MKTRRIISVMVVGAGLVAVASGCSKESESEPPLMPASGPYVPRSDYTTPPPVVPGVEGREGAIFDLTRARCDFEWRCLNVGIDRRYSHLDACKYEFNTMGYNELSEDRCAAGVDRTKLQRCVQSFERLSCEQSVTDLGDVPNCDPSDLCE